MNKEFYGSNLVKLSILNNNCIFRRNWPG